MARSLSTDGLPSPLATAVRPWIGVVEGARLGMGEEVRVTAANACQSLGWRIVVTRPLEAAISDARRASDALAIELDRRSTVATRMRVEALTTLDGLIAALRDARPNARAEGLGLGW